MIFRNQNYMNLCLLEWDCKLHMHQTHLPFNNTNDVFRKFNSCVTLLFENEWTCFTQNNTIHYYLALWKTINDIQCLFSGSRNLALPNFFYPTSSVNLSFSMICITHCRQVWIKIFSFLGMHWISAFPRARYAVVCFKIMFKGGINII